MSIEFTMKGGGLNRLSNFLKIGPKQITQSFRAAVLYTEGVIKKDFMTVKDGSLLFIDKNGSRHYTKRTTTPGVRASTGNLRRLTKTEFRIVGNSLEGAIGTDVDYGQHLEEDTNFKFLKPGLEKAMPEVKRMLEGSIQAELSK